MSPGVPRQRYAHLDALRAIAALAVMVEHMFGDLLRQAPAATGAMRIFAGSVIENLSLGRFGVALFFLISGFVVPFSIAGERPLRHFAISRVFRLYPAFWLALAALKMTAWLNGDTPRTATVLANLTMAPPLFGRPWLSPIHWTLFVELLFYVLVALLFFARALRHVGILLGLSLALIAATVLPVQLHVHGIASLPAQYLGMHLSFLFLGLLLRLWLIEQRQGSGFAASILILTQIAGLLLVTRFSLARGDNFVMEGLKPVLSAYMLAIAVFLATIGLEWPRSRLLARIGLISYSMYLFHGTVNGLVYRILPLTGQFSDIGTMLLCVSLTLLLSWIVYLTVERPMIRLGRWISSRHTPLLARPSQFADAVHARSQSPLASRDADIHGSAIHRPSACGAVAPDDGCSPTREAEPTLDDMAPASHASDKLVGTILGIAIAAVALSWFALLGYVGWKIAESL